MEPSENIPQRRARGNHRRMDDLVPTPRQRVLSGVAGVFLAIVLVALPQLAELNVPGQIQLPIRLGQVLVLPLLTIQIAAWLRPQTRANPLFLRISRLVTNFVVCYCVATLFLIALP